MTRARADISELNLGRTTSVHFPDGKEKLLNFEVTIKPEEGMYKCAPPFAPFLRATHSRCAPLRRLGVGM